MPIMDGWETTLALKILINHGTIPKIPIVGLTAFTTRKDLEKCMQAGMKEVMHKPLNYNRFLEVEARIVSD